MLVEAFLKKKIQNLNPLILKSSNVQYIVVAVYS